MSLRLIIRAFLGIVLCAQFSVHYAFAEQTAAPKTPIQSQEQAVKTLFTDFIKYAKFAQASYSDVDDMKRTCASYDYVFKDSGANINDKVRYFIATNPVTKTHIISVRGTANMENTILDLDYELTEDKTLGIAIHKGFAQSAHNIYKMLKNSLHKDYAIDITGHSLGGAVAVILAMVLDKHGYKIHQVVTFGQPKVTDRLGAQKYQHLNVVHINNLDDIIPTLPPFDASEILSLKINVFWPLGKEYVLLSDNYFSLLQGLDSVLRGIDFLNKKPGEENISAHQIDTYLQRLKSLRDGGIEIPFEQRDKYLKRENPSSV